MDGGSRMKIELIDKIFNVDNTQELNYFYVQLYNGESFKYYYENIVGIEVNHDYRSLIIKYSDYSGNISIDYISSNRIEIIAINKVV